MLNVGLHTYLENISKIFHELNEANMQTVEVNEVRDWTKY
jgi:hypothetical protein